MPAFKKIPIGKRFGRLVVSGGVIWRGSISLYPCNCDCGGQTVSVGSQLRNGTAQSCGCARKESLIKLSTTHGGSKSALYKVWSGMKARCSNPNHISYRYYGAKGIAVSASFQQFSAFKAWSIRSGYKQGLTLDRKDGNGGYSPKNCRWVNRKVQNRNSNSAHLLNFRGRVRCLEEWSESTGIMASTIRARLKNGWPVWKALSQ